MTRHVARTSDDGAEMTSDPVRGAVRRRSCRLGRRWAGVAVVSVAALLAAACGGGGGNDASGGGAQTQGATPSASGGAGTPKVGGTLSLAEYSAPSGLDPIVVTIAGTTGMIEATAVYDTLLRYNYDTGRYDPGTALSATPNGDSTVWTIKLRPGVTFTDGTPYDAEAVAFELNRARSGTEGGPPCEQYFACPRNSNSSSFSANYIKDVAATDATTVQVTLKQSWGSFPVALAAGLGLIPSPTAVKKACSPSAPVNQCSFNTAPVGAGPFKVTSFKAGEAITMVRNPDYWGGQVYLDGVTFVNNADSGGQKTVDAVNANELQAAVIRDPVSLAAARSHDFGVYADLQYAGSELTINAGSKNAGDVRVRQAIGFAVDPNVVNQRGFQGKAMATSQLFSSSFRWFPDVPGPAFDPAKAKQLVADAKADGWNGHIGLITSNAPFDIQIGLAVQAMLQNVGMTVDLDNGRTQQAIIGLLVKKDYDVMLSGMPIGNDDTAALGIAQNFTSTAASNHTGLSDPTLDAEVAQLFSASTDSEKKAAYGAISTELNKQMPMLSLATVEQSVVWNSHVHGLVRDEKTNVHLDKAWLG